MIKLNEQYSINNGQGSIVFSEGNKGTVNAEVNALIIGYILLEL